MVLLRVVVLDETLERALITAAELSEAADLDGTGEAKERVVKLRTVRRLKCIFATLGG
jgi:hypothetical protein